MKLAIVFSTLYCNLHSYLFQNIILNTQVCCGCFKPIGTYQHGSSEVKLVKELCDEDVDLDKILCILLLNLTDDVSQPLKLVLGTSHPDEVNLYRSDTTVKSYTLSCSTYLLALDTTTN